VSALGKRTLLALAILLALYNAVILSQYYIEGASTHSISDFNNFWEPAEKIHAGQSAMVYDTGESQAIVDKYPHALNGRFKAFVYPPQALFLIAPLAYFPHDVALLLWSFLPVILYYGMVFMLLKHSTLQQEDTKSRRMAYVVAAVAVLPFMKASLYSAQSGALLAVFFLAMLHDWNRRPARAGIWLSLMVIKLHMAMLVPFALAVSGRWRTIVAAAVASAVLIVAVTLWLGAGIWTDYLHMAQWFEGFMLSDKMSIVLALGPYLTLTSSGFPVRFSWGVQAVVSIYMLVTVVGVFREKDTNRQDLRFGLLACGMLLATPYGYCYDMPLLAAAILPLFVRIWREGFGGALENIALAAIIATPYAQPALRLPVGLVALALLFSAVKRRYRVENPLYFVDSPS